MSTAISKLAGNRSIRTKLIFHFVIITLILGLLMGIYLNFVQSKTLHDELERNGVTLAMQLSESSINPMLTDNYVNLQWLVENVAATEKDVLYVFILDENRNVVAHTFQNGFPDQLQYINSPSSEAGTLLLDTEYGLVTDVSYPVLGGRSGEVHVGMSHARVNASVFQSNVVLILFMLLLMAIGISGSYFSARKIFSPLAALNQGVVEFGKGNLEQKVVITSGDEIGDLSRSFNEMADRIRSLIADKEQYSREILETRNYLNTIISGSRDGILVLDSRTTIEFCNEAFCVISGFAKYEVMGDNILNYIPAFKKHLNASPGAKKVNLLVETNIITKDGSLTPLFLSIQNIDYQGDLKYVLIARDISEQKEFESLKNNLISNISHELRTPLNIMRGFVEISITEDDKEKRNIFLTKSIEAADRQNWMIQDLLEVASTLNGPDKISLTKESINSVLYASLDALKSKIAFAGIKVIRNTEKDHMVHADPEKLKYALTKILDNAIKFNIKNGTIEVGTNSYGDFVEIYVRDTGIGIDKKYMGRIFERFYQIDGSSTRKYGGTGLGLSIARDIVLGHGGNIWLESEPGKGSTFHITVKRYVSPPIGEVHALQPAFN
jgi:PAS domain S-box-containing protein